MKGNEEILDHFDSDVLAQGAVYSESGYSTDLVLVIMDAARLAQKSEEISFLVSILDPLMPSSAYRKIANRIDALDKEIKANAPSPQN